MAKTKSKKCSCGRILNLPLNKKIKCSCGKVWMAYRGNKDRTGCIRVTRQLMSEGDMLKKLSALTGYILK